MTSRTRTPKLHDLLVRAAWARRLARHLVLGRDSDADDLLQDAWMAASTKAGQRPASPQWVAGVLRVLGMRRARADVRRRRRESESVGDPSLAAPQAASVPDDLLDHVETQRRLSEALLALAEPYRTTVGLRYYEELSAAEIGRRMAVPAGTVRWRLKEGLERLRRYLDEHFGGSRAARLALVGFATSGRALKRIPRIAIGGALTLAGASLVGLFHSAAPQPDHPLLDSGRANDATSTAYTKEIPMQKSVAVLALAAALSSAAESTVMAGSIPASRVPRYWVPLGVGPVKGPSDAKVTILAFLDYESPFSLRASQSMAALLAAHPGKARYQVIHRPLPFHRKSPYAAKAALAAGLQGRFWDMHDALLSNQNALSPADIERHAKKVGLDLERFRADVIGPTVATQAEAEEANAQGLKVTGIPAFFFNGRSVVGAQPRAVLETVLVEEITYAEAVLKAGVQPRDLYNAVTKAGAAQLPDSEAAASGQSRDTEGPDSPTFRAARKVVTENTGIAQACFERALLHKPELRGTLVVDLRLSSGKAPQVLMRETSMGFPWVDNCIVTSLRTLSYPGLAAGEPEVLVRHAFTYPIAAAH